jgi:hypothetical protein
MKDIDRSTLSMKETTPWNSSIPAVVHQPSDLATNGYILRLGFYYSWSLIWLWLESTFHHIYWRRSGLITHSSGSRHQSLRAENNHQLFVSLCAASQHIS